MEYKNFFESEKEAAIRLYGTVVLYGSEPVEIISLHDHLGDGTIYAYIRPVGLTKAELTARPEPTGMHQYSPGSKQQGVYLDKWISDNPTGQISRAPLSAPEFNRFRPFELGMHWNDEHVYYVERQPNRRTEQGLTSSMLLSRKLDLTNGPQSAPVSLSLHTPEMKRCIKGEHPTAQRCIEALTGGKYANQAAAFHRHFAFIRGPVDTLFLAYKNDCIGVLPHGDLSGVKLAKDFNYTREIVDELHLFNDIRY